MYQSQCPVCNPGHPNPSGLGQAATASQTSSLLFLLGFGAVVYAVLRGKTAITEEQQHEEKGQSWYANFKQYEAQGKIKYVDAKSGKDITPARAATRPVNEINWKFDPADDIFVGEVSFEDRSIKVSY